MCINVTAEVRMNPNIDLVPYDSRLSGVKIACLICRVAKEALNVNFGNEWSTQMPSPNPRRREGPVRYVLDLPGIRAPIILA